VSLPLPPPRLIRCDAATARDVRDQLTSVIAGHPQATTTYRFYEELDTWLGPWGAAGYPIGYGKFYNILFTSNQRLQANATSQQWVWRTTIRLQEALRDYVVGRIHNCTLPSLSEAELRRAAFNSHPAAYDRGGLAMVVLTAPELALVIATIPAAEFMPTSDDFGPTVEQVFVTLGRVVPQLVGNVLAASAGPAHTGILRRAVEMDQRRLLNEIAIVRELGSIKAAIERGDVDHIPLLDRVISQLNLREFPNQGFAQAAREVVDAATARRRTLINRLNQWFMQSPDLRRRVNERFPNVVR
jgi:hypothetical protein